MEANKSQACGRDECFWRRLDWRQQSDNSSERVSKCRDPGCGKPVKNESREEIGIMMGCAKWSGWTPKMGAPLDAGIVEIALGYGVGKWWKSNSGGCTRTVVGRIPTGGQQMTEHGLLTGSNGFVDERGC
ncbi:hypothetical protein GB937_005304 [Aspergillus fischeri]|nr:hypothetical protein GB937_005304 [Aspergillus fischeri]